MLTRRAPSVAEPVSYRIAQRLHGAAVWGAKRLPVESAVTAGVAVTRIDRGLTYAKQRISIELSCVKHEHQT